MKQKINWTNVAAPFVVAGLFGYGAFWFFHARHTLGDPDFVLSAQELTNAFSINELEATAKFENKVVKIPAKYTTSGISLGKPWIVFNGTRSLSGISGIQCYFRRANAASQIPQNKEITIKGRVAGKLIYVQLQDCARVFR